MELANNPIKRMRGKGGSREQLQEDCTAHPAISTITIMESLLAMLGRSSSLLRDFARDFKPTM